MDAVENGDEIVPWLLMLTPNAMKEIIFDERIPESTRKLGFLILQSAQLGDWKSLVTLIDRVM